MPSNLTNIEKLWEAMESKHKALPAPSGTKDEQAIELLRRCAERESSLFTLAIESEREGDEDFTWIAMAGRAENNRLRDRILVAMPHLKPRHEGFARIYGGAVGINSETA